MSSRTKRAARQPNSKAVSPPPPNPLQAVTGILIAAVAVTPLALITGFFISHDVIPKLVMLTAAAAVLIVLYPRLASGLQALWGQRKGRAFLLLVLAQFVSLVISTLLSSRIPLSIAGTTWRRFGLLGQTAGLVIALAVACAVVARPSWVRTLLRAVSICGGLAASYGILQYFGIDPFLDRRLYSIDYFGGISRPPATLGHALYFSAYLVPVFFLAAASAFGDPDRLWRRIHGGVAVLAVSAIVLSATRSAAMAVIIGGVLFAQRAIRGSRRIPLKFALAPVVIVAAVAAFLISPAGATLRHRIDQWRSDQGGPRLQMWKETPGLIALHPVFGEGPEVFAAEFRKIQSAQLSRNYPDFYNETPHNALLDAACAQGIPGALILVGVFALAWSSGRRADFSANPVRAGLDAAMLGILVSSMFASLTLVTSLYLWSVLALAVALNSDTVAEKPERTARIPLPALAVLALALVTPAIMLARQDAAWADMEREVNRGNFAAAQSAWSRAISGAFGLPGYELWASREWATLGRALGNSPDAAAAWKLGSDAAALAESRGEEPFSAAYQASVLQVAQASLEGGEAKARDAIRLAPNWYKAHLLRSQLLGYMGKKDEAARELEVSVSLGYRKP